MPTRMSGGLIRRKRLRAMEKGRVSDRDRAVLVLVRQEGSAADAHLAAVIRAGLVAVTALEAEPDAGISSVHPDRAGGRDAGRRRGCRLMLRGGNVVRIRVGDGSAHEKTSVWLGCVTNRVCGGYARPRREGAFVPSRMKNVNILGVFEIQNARVSSERLRAATELCSEKRRACAR